MATYIAIFTNLTIKSPNIPDDSIFINGEISARGIWKKVVADEIVTSISVSCCHLDEIGSSRGSVLSTCHVGWLLEYGRIFIDVVQFER